jgi:hypothetical protein
MPYQTLDTSQLAWSSGWIAEYSADNESDCSCTVFELDKLLLVSFRGSVFEYQLTSCTITNIQISKYLWQNRHLHQPSFKYGKHVF